MKNKDYPKTVIVGGRGDGSPCLRARGDKRGFRIAFRLNQPKLHFCALAVAVVCFCGQAPARAAPPLDLQRAAKTWIAGQPGGVAGAWVDADGVEFFSAGPYSAAKTRSVSADTQFEVGSLTKIFTAVLLADGIQRDEVKLSDPVGAPFARSAVTYLQLATHTSGLPRMPAGFIPADPANPHAEFDLDALIAAFNAAAPALRPAASSYSNFGFAVLGHAVAGAARSDYAALLRARVLGPLRMKDTVLSWRDAHPRRLAPGHNGAGPALNWDLAAFTPAAGLVSTPRDLARFLQACLGFKDTPLAAALAVTARPWAPGEMPGSQIGLAWQIVSSGGRTLVWHGGATGGYRSFIGYDPDRKTGVVVLTNHACNLEELGFALLAGHAPAPPVPESPPAEALKPFLGNYLLGPSFVITVTADGGQLFAQATNHPPLRLQPGAADHFTIEGSKAEIIFVRDARDTIEALFLRQNGTDQRAPRLAPGERPKERLEIALPPTVLAGYAGAYDFAPGLVLTVTAEGGKLFAQMTGQPKLRVFAEAGDRFFYKSVDAQLAFERDAAGQPVAVTLHQNGRDLVGMKQ